MTFDIQTLPKSTQDYLKVDGGTQLAVDALLRVGLNTLPNLTNWNELNLYYKARAAAELTKLEWAQSMYMLWQYIWGDNINADWKVEGIDELKKNQSITIKDCWEEDGLAVLHNKKDFMLYTTLEVAPNNLTLAFSLERGEKEHKIVKGELENFIWDDNKKSDWTEWNYHEIQGNILSDSNLIEQARKSAAAAIEHCNEKS